MLNVEFNDKEIHIHILLDIETNNVQIQSRQSRGYKFIYPVPVTWTVRIIGCPYYSPFLQ
jgi:hypothetical protein